MFSSICSLYSKSILHLSKKTENKDSSASVSFWSFFRAISSGIGKYLPGYSYSCVTIVLTLSPEEKWIFSAGLLSDGTFLMGSTIGFSSLYFFFFVLLLAPPTPLYCTGFLAKKKKKKTEKNNLFIEFWELKIVW
jgi:hypothetical protein